MVEALLFFAPASLIIIGALIVIFAKNPVHNAMGLVMTLVSLAIIYITLNATFVAMVQMLVYAGAVMTLFLFVIMMIGVLVAAGSYSWKVVIPLYPLLELVSAQGSAVLSL